MPFRLLRIAAGAELASLIVLLGNLATVHWPPVSSTVGPIHGCAYLFVIVAVLRETCATRQAKAFAFVPGIGGLLALRRLTPAAPGPAKHLMPTRHPA